MRHRPVLIVVAVAVLLDAVPAAAESGGGGVRSDEFRRTSYGAPQPVTVSDCARWNRHPLTTDANNRYTGPGTLYLDKARIDAFPLLYTNGRPNSGTSTYTGGDPPAELLVGNARSSTAAPSPPSSATPTPTSAATPAGAAS